MGFTERQKRAILKRDNYECQFSKKFGIAGDTGVPCSEILEVHHKQYPKDRRERLSDGVTVCKSCHENITDYKHRLKNESFESISRDYRTDVPVYKNKSNV